MIILLILYAVVGVLNVVLGSITFFVSTLAGVTVVTALSLPFGVDTFFINGLQYLHKLVEWIPPLGIMFNGFVSILVYKLVMWVLHLVRIIK